MSSPTQNGSASEPTQPVSQDMSNLGLAYEEYQKEVLKDESAAQKGEAGQLVLDRIKDLENLFTAVKEGDSKNLSIYMKDSEALRRTAEFAFTNAEHVKFGDLGGTLSLKTFVKASKRFMNPDLAHETEDVPLEDNAETMNLRFNSFDWKKWARFFPGWRSCGALSFPLWPSRHPEEAHRTSYQEC